MNSFCLIIVRLSHFFLWLCYSLSIHPHNMTKKGGKKKAKVHEEDSDLEVFPRMKIIYEDTKAVTGAEPEFQWGQIYHMIKY